MGKSGIFLHRLNLGEFMVIRTPKKLTIFLIRSIFVNGTEGCAEP
jgi:hypothetical protein